MKLIEQDEMAELLGILRRKRLPLADFQLQEIDTTDPKTDEINALEGIVTVFRNSTKRERQYLIGDGREWVAKFADDLDAGIFD